MIDSKEPRGKVVSVEEALEPMLARLNYHKERLASMTPAERADWERAKQAREQEVINARIMELRQNWNAPLRQVKCAPNRTGPWGKKLSSLIELMAAEDGVTLGLIGGRGTGKTQLAVELMKERTRAQKSAYFTTATEFFIAVKATYGDDALVNEEAVLRRFARYSLLVVDEIGKRGGSEWENNLLFEMLNRRYNSMRDTILIDNRTRAEFISTIGPSLASRMSEGGGIIECNWKSFRE